MGSLLHSRTSLLGLNQQAAELRDFYQRLLTWGYKIGLHHNKNSPAREMNTRKNRGLGCRRSCNTNPTSNPFTQQLPILVLVLVLACHNNNSPSPAQAQELLAQAEEAQESAQASRVTVKFIERRPSWSRTSAGGLPSTASSGRRELRTPIPPGTNLHDIHILAAAESDSSRARRVLLQRLNRSSTTFRPLAAKIDRIDPLDHFRKYKAGYDLKSKHYWASVIFTGIYGYAIAAAWALLGLLLSLIVCTKSLLNLLWERRRRRRSSSSSSSCSRSKNPRRAPTSASWIPRLVVVVLSAAAIGCIVALYVSIQEFKSQATDVEDVVLEAAQNATDSIHTVSTQIASVYAIMKPYSTASFLTSLNSIENTLNEQANNVESKVLVNKKTYKHVVDIIEIVLLLMTTITLLLIVIGLASTFLMWIKFLYIILVLAWIMTTLSWVSFGIFYAAHNVGLDTCLSLQEYLQNPVNTTLNTLLPCAALESANHTYLEARIGISTVIHTQNVTFMTYAQSITSLTGLCDPIGPAPDYTYTGVCPNTTLPIGDLQEVIAPLVCNNTNPAAISAACLSSGKLITEQANATLTDLSRAGQGILDTFPLIDGLTNCSFVTDTVSIIVTQKCKAANDAIDHLWIAFLVLSSLMLFLIAFWDAANRLNSRQHYLATIIPQDRVSSPDPYKAIIK